MVTPRMSSSDCRMVLSPTRKRSVANQNPMGCVCHCVVRRIPFCSGDRPCLCDVQTQSSDQPVAFSGPAGDFTDARCASFTLAPCVAHVELFPAWSRTRNLQDHFLVWADQIFSPSLSLGGSTKEQIEDPPQQHHAYGCSSVLWSGTSKEAPIVSSFLMTKLGRLSSLTSSSARQIVIVLVVNVCCFN